MKVYESFFFICLVLIIKYVKEIGRIDVINIILRKDVIGDGVFYRELW